MSKLYAFDLVVLSSLPAAAFESAVLGARALFVARVGAKTRTVSGIVRAVEHVGVRDLGGERVVQHQVRLVPFADKLKRRRGSRIFQNLRFDEVIAEVAKAAGVDVRFSLEDKYPKRAYLTQYEETEEAFVRRLAAENGVLSYFEQPREAGERLLAEAGAAGELAGMLSVAEVATLLAGGALHGDARETWVFTDRADYLPLEPADGDARVPKVSVQAAGALGVQDETVIQAELERSQRPTTAIFRAFDPDRPANPFEAGRDADGPMPPSGPGGMVGRPEGAPGAQPPSVAEPRDLVFFDHDPRDLFLDWPTASREPEIMLAQLRRRARVARGKSSAVRFSAGHCFHLDGHDVDELNQPYVVIGVEHVGYAGKGGAGAAEEQLVYENTFECVPAAVRYAPKRPRRRAVQTTLTAVVVGPPGEEIHTDEEGRIQVRFHWDRSEKRHETTCWVRCMQPWAGATWGFQFIPRVGMEVVVGFDGGDPDKPLVLGTLYNRILPVPFKLPDEKSKSGIRTKSTPKSEGFNEIVFEDAAGKEQISVRAERDLVFFANHDRETKIANDDRLDVKATRHVAVEKDLVYEVKGKRDAIIEGGDRLEVRGGFSTVVAGDSHEKVVGTKRTDVVGEDRRFIEGVGETIVKGDSVTDIRGNAALIVGRNDAKKSLSALVEGVVSVVGSGSVHVRSDAEIILQVKDSFLRISEAGIELGGPAVSVRGEGARMNVADGEARIQTEKTFQVISADEIKMKTDGGNFGLTKSEAKLAGTKVKLGGPTSVSDEDKVEPPQPAEIELVDQNGKPVPNQRFVIDLETGGQVTGFLDDKGKAKVFLDAPGDISFPDLAEVDG